ncbi:MAG: DUF2490 domain-containing protein [Chitinophagales bacterium]|nr:DUF2490 domain-containing protein [Chitinophagales bacterium]
MFIFFSGFLYGQHHDPATWIQIGAEVDLPNKFIAGISEQVRYNIETADPYRLLTDLVLEYKIDKDFKTGIEYRHSALADARYDRFAAMLSYQNGIGKFDLGFKTKIQYSLQPADNEDNTAWRNKISLKYDKLKNMKPYVSLETFYQISNVENTFNTIRPEIGIDLQLSDNHEITVYYLIDKEFNEPDPLTLYVVGLNYLFKFKV